MQCFSTKHSQTTSWASIVALCAVSAHAELVELNESALSASAGSAVIILHVNWGRHWGCAGLDNAQLQVISFSRWPDGPALELRTPSRLSVEDKFIRYALLVDPGEYFLTDFDVKIAKSARDVGHLIGQSVLFENDKPVGGSFTADTGEFVYIGHFSLDCSEEPIPWRYYIVGADDFQRYSEAFRKDYPFIGDAPVVFRLFDTSLFGTAYSLGDGS